MKVSGKIVAEAILKKLEKEITRPPFGGKDKKLHPGLAIILAGNDPSSKIYVTNKIKAADRIGIKAKLYQFSENELDSCLKRLDQLNNDKSVHGIVIQHPVYSSWNYDDLLKKLDPKKDVDGFLPNSPFSGATALAVWEMLTAFAFEEGFKKTENFLDKKKIVLIGKGRAAGGPIFKLLSDKRIPVEVVEKNTRNPGKIIKSADILISATGVKNIVNKDNLKKGAYVVGVGTGDLNEEDVAKIAKLYNPNIGGIGPLTIVSLLKNVVQSAKGSR